MQISRLKKREDFLNARKGARSHGRAFVLQLVKRKVCADIGLRVGFTVTKKVGNAVIRNRIKRRLRQAVQLADIPSHVKGHDAVLIARIEAQSLPFTELVDSLTHAFSTAKRPVKRNKLNDGVAKSRHRGQ